MLLWLGYKQTSLKYGDPALNYVILLFTHDTKLRLCLTGATHNLKWVRYTHIITCRIWIKILGNIANSMPIYPSTFLSEGQNKKADTCYRYDYPA